MHWRVPNSLAVGALGLCLLGTSEAARPVGIPRQLEVHANPVDAQRGCIETASFERLAHTKDPRDQRRRFPTGELALSVCVRRLSDGRVFASPAPLASLDPNEFEACPPTVSFKHCSCEFSQCTNESEQSFSVACSVEDYCWSTGVAPTGLQHEAPESFESHGACSEASAPNHRRCSYTPEGSCHCEGERAAIALLHPD